MQAAEAKTIMILRRMKRDPASKLPWRAYNPAKAKPEELRFDVLDEKEKVIGQLAYTKLGFSHFKWEDSVMNTPWGEGVIRPEKYHYRISIDGSELFLMKETGAVLKKGIELTAPNGAKLNFKRTGFPCANIEYSDARGYVAVLEEHGALTIRTGGRPASLTKEEIKMLSKEDRPTSVESLLYVQYRLKTSGALPVRLEDVVAAMFMYVSFQRLIEESFGGIASC